MKSAKKDSNTKPYYVNVSDIPKIYTEFDRRHMKDGDNPIDITLNGIRRAFEDATVSEMQALYLAAIYLRGRAVPEVAPELFSERPLQGGQRESVIEFIRRVYGAYLPNGLSKADIRRLDPQLYRAYWNWASRNELPSDLELPTKADALDCELNHIVSATGGGSATEVWAEIHKFKALAESARRRMK